MSDSDSSSNSSGDEPLPSPPPPEVQAPPQRHVIIEIPASPEEQSPEGRNPAVPKPDRKPSGTPESEERGTEPLDIVKTPSYSSGDEPLPVGVPSPPPPEVPAPPRRFVIFEIRASSEEQSPESPNPAVPKPDRKPSGTPETEERGTEPLDIVKTTSFSSVDEPLPVGVPSPPPPEVPAPRRRLLIIEIPASPEEQSPEEDPNPAVTKPDSKPSGTPETEEWDTEPLDIVKTTTYSSVDESLLSPPPPEVPAPPQGLVINEILASSEEQSPEEDPNPAVPKPDRKPSGTPETEERGTEPLDIVKTTSYSSGVVPLPVGVPSPPPTDVPAPPARLVITEIPESPEEQSPEEDLNPAVPKPVRKPSGTPKTEERGTEPLDIVNVPSYSSGDEPLPSPPPPEVPAQPPGLVVIEIPASSEEQSPDNPNPAVPKPDRKPSGTPETGERGRERMRKRHRSPSTEPNSSCSDLPYLRSPPKKKRKSLSRKSQSCHLCFAKVKNLSRHLRNVHKKEPARYATNYQGYIIRQCPITGCGRFYARIKQHLRKFHKMVDSNMIQEVSKKAKPLTMSPERPLNLKSVNTPSPAKGVIIVNPSLRRAGPSVIPQTAPVRPEAFDPSPARGVVTLSPRIRLAGPSVMPEAAAVRPEAFDPSPARGVVTVSPRIRRAGPSVMPEAAPVMPEAFDPSPARGVVTVSPRIRRAGPSVMPEAAPVMPEAFDMDFSSTSEDEAPRPPHAAPKLKKVVLVNYSSSSADNEVASITNAAPYGPGCFTPPLLSATSSGESESGKFSQPVPEPMQTSSDPETETPETETPETSNRRIWTEIPSIQSFHHWLTGPDNDKSHCTATQHAKQILTVWKRVSPTLTIEDLFNLEEVKEKWLRPFLQSFRPGTVKSYCGSVALFLEFTLFKELTDQRGNAAAALAEYRHMSKSLRRRCLRRRTEVEAESLESLITPDQILSLLKSRKVKVIESLLQDPHLFLDDMDLFLACRNYLMFCVLVANGQRTGVLQAISPAAIDKARITSDGAVVTIAKHKTDYMGPAHVAFPEPLWTYVKSYLHCLKNFPCYDTNAMRKSSIFVRFDASTQTAMALSTSAINKGINKLWAEVHGTPVSATLIRKSVVTNVRKTIPGSRDMLAAHMSHHPGTADRYYNLARAQDMAMPMSKTISATMTRPPQNETVEPGTCSALALEKAPGSSSTLALEKAPGSSSTLALEEAPGPSSTLALKEARRPSSTRDPALDEAPLSVQLTPTTETLELYWDDDDVVPPSPPPTRTPEFIESHGRRTFSTGEVSTLLRVCQPLMEGSFTSATVLEALEADPEGAQLVETVRKRCGKDYRKKLTDRLRTHIRTERKRSLDY